MVQSVGLSQLEVLLYLYPADLHKRLHYWNFGLHRFNWKQIETCMNILVLRLHIYRGRPGAIRPK